MNHSLSIILFEPLAGAMLLLLVSKQNENAIRWIANITAFVGFVISIPLWFRFNVQSGELFQFQERAPWIPSIGAEYFLGADGLSTLLILLTTMMGSIAVLSSWTAITERVKEYYIFLLVLQTGMLGAFMALDFLLFFLFWEVMLVPMYFLIGIWGSANRLYSAIKFFLYTLFGSVFMLLGFLALYFSGPEPHTFDLVKLTEFGANGGYAHTFQLIVFGAVALGFAIKVPMWPFHTWLPDAHTEAPTIGSVLLAGIMLKMGAYGFIRIALPILPQAARVWAPIIGVLAAIAIVYASLACLAQKDLKRLIAFSSVGHMGFVMLGIATLTDVGINAAIFGMVAHGVITGMLFFEVGSIYDRYHTRQIADIGGGMLQKVPYLAGIFAFTCIASLGLPGLAGFWGEVTALLSSYNPAGVLAGHITLFRTLMVFGGIGTILTAGYFLWTLQRVNMGTVPETWKDKVMPDITTTEWLAWAPLLVGIVLLGLIPRIVFGTTNDAVAGLAHLFNGLTI
jgi:NADH-quinone oxidoreductase subunit M